MEREHLAQVPTVLTPLPCGPLTFTEGRGMIPDPPLTLYCHAQDNTPTPPHTHTQSSCRRNRKKRVQELLKRGPHG